MPQYSLMSHQVDGVNFLDSVDGIGALLFDPGVGKTGTTLSWIDRMAKRRGEFRVLVVAPLTAADTWVLQAPPFMDATVKARLLEGRTVDILDQIKRARDWIRVPNARVQANHRGNAAKVTILSMSAGAVSSFCTERTRTVKLLQAVRKFRPDLVVVDESHIIKSDTANISRAMYQIGQLAPHRIILTGTVSPHSPLDVYGQWRFLAPWTFSDSYHEAWTKTPLRATRAQLRSVKPWAFKRFGERYGKKGGYKGKSVDGLNQLGEQELHDRVAERSMNVRKEDALDLPPVTDIDVTVRLDAREEKFYQDMREELLAELDDGTLLEAPNALAKMMKLRQITAGFIRDTETGEVHVTGTSKQKAVAEIVNVQLANENRIVVFAYFKSEVAALAAMLKARGRTVETVTGATPNKERLAIRQRFADVSGNPGQRVLVAQARTMSLSVNELVVAQHAIFASLSERRDDWVQARGRLDRNGQVGNKVTFWNVGVPGTVDEIMLNNHKRRGDMEKAMLDHIRATPRPGRKAA